ncbi:MAG: VPLPA-CTERM sorting domain-containing protein, partial [Pseudomonadota bacterium]
AGSVAAAPVTADFRAEIDLPDIPSSGPRVFEALGEAVSGGPDLDLSNEVSNPNGFSGHVEMDLDASGLVTLTGRQPSGFADYDLGIFTISNIAFDAGESVTGIVAVGDQNLLDPFFGLGQVAPTLSFTSDSISILFDTTGSGDVADFEFADGGVSQFQILTSELPQVPVPAALPMLLSALGGLAFVSRRRKKS